jgi:hypothetical protein
LVPFSCSRREKRGLELDLFNSRERAYWFWFLLLLSNIPRSRWFLVGMLIIIIIVLWMLALSSVFLKHVSISFCSFVVSTLFLNAYELLSKCRQVGRYRRDPARVNTGCGH